MYMLMTVMANNVYMVLCVSGALTEWWFHDSSISASTGTGKGGANKLCSQLFNAFNFILECAIDFVLISEISMTVSECSFVCAVVYSSVVWQSLLLFIAILVI